MDDTPQDIEPTTAEPGSSDQSDPPTKPIKVQKVSGLSVDAYAQLQLDIAREQRREEMEELAAYDAARTREAEERRRQEAEANALPPYHFRLTYMTMFSWRNFLSVLFGLGVAGYFAYVLWQHYMHGVNVIDPGQPMPEMVDVFYVWLFVGGLLFGLVKLMYIIIHYRKDRVSIKDGAFVYTPPWIPWLLMFGGENSSKQVTLRQAATADFQQNPIESAFKMDSASFVLDSAGKENGVFKKLRGVPHIKLLKMHLAQ